MAVLCWITADGVGCYVVQVEIQVLQSLKHPNIIRIEDVYLSGSKICMVWRGRTCDCFVAM